MQVSSGARFVVAYSQPYGQPRLYQVVDTVNAARYILITTNEKEARKLCAKLEAGK